MIPPCVSATPRQYGGTSEAVQVVVVGLPMVSCTDVTLDQAIGID